MRVRVVLVEPLEAGNVGAAARAMKNFGFTDLWIVGGKKERVDDVSAWWAVGAIDVVENATRVDTLEEALVECHLTVATTAVRERQVYDHLSPSDVAKLANEQLSDEHRIAVGTDRTRGDALPAHRVDSDVAGVPDHEPGHVRGYLLLRAGPRTASRAGAARSRRASVGQRVDQEDARAVGRDRLLRRQVAGPHVRGVAGDRGPRGADDARGVVAAGDGAQDQRVETQNTRNGSDGSE
jgi:hypothetical protein